MVQTTGRLYDEIAKLMNDAAGVAASYSLLPLFDLSGRKTEPHGRPRNVV